MITSYERADLLHIMRMNRFDLKDANAAQLSFSQQIGNEDYEIGILVVEDLPIVTIKRNGQIKHSEIPKSVGDMKIFLEERLYKYLEE
jgi:hypothetical protein